MKNIRILLSIILAITLVAVFPAPGRAAPGDEQTFYFVSSCSNNNAGDVAIGTAQMVVTVKDVGDGQVGITFLNLGPADSSITDVYFDDGTLLGISLIEDGPGVDFEQGASPGNLPSGNTCNPNFEATQGFTADSEPRVQPNGVNPVAPGQPVEYVTIFFRLINDKTFADLILDMGDGDLVIGIHVQGFASGGSETFVSYQKTTAITLASFGAAVKQGQVAVSWTTGTETNNAGFNIYRSSSPAGGRVKINAGLLAAKGDPTSGYAYTLADRPGYGAFYYWLEDLDLSGKSTLHGPVSVNTLRSPVFRPFAPTFP